MANEFYLCAGLTPIDSADSPAINAFYITAGLVANDYEAGLQKSAAGSLTATGAVSRKLMAKRSISGEL